jgi:hypothetical protein
MLRQRVARRHETSSSIYWPEEDRQRFWQDTVGRCPPAQRAVPFSTDDM